MYRNIFPSYSGILICSQIYISILFFPYIFYPNGQHLIMLINCVDSIRLLTEVEQHVIGKTWYYVWTKSLHIFIVEKWNIMHDTRMKIGISIQIKALVWVYMILFDNYS